MCGVCSLDGQCTGIAACLLLLCSDNRGRRKDRHDDEVVDSDEDTGEVKQKRKRGRKRNEEGAPRAKRCVCVCVCVKGAGEKLHLLM